MELWAYGTSPGGLALDSAAFWALTPREYAALRKGQEESRAELRQMYASIQAAIHNAWLRPKGRRAYRPDDFLKRMEPQTWQEKQSILRTMLTASGSHLPKVELPPG